MAARNDFEEEQYQDAKREFVELLPEIKKTQQNFKETDDSNIHSDGVRLIREEKIIVEQLAEIAQLETKLNEERKMLAKYTSDIQNDQTTITRELKKIDSDYSQALQKAMEAANKEYATERKEDKLQLPHPHASNPQEEINNTFKRLYKPLGTHPYVEKLHHHLQIQLKNFNIKSSLNNDFYTLSSGKTGARQLKSNWPSWNEEERAALVQEKFLQRKTLETAAISGNIQTQLHAEQLKARELIAEFSVTGAKYITVANKVLKEKEKNQAIENAEASIKQSAELQIKIAKIQKAISTSDEKLTLAENKEIKIHIDKIASERARIDGFSLTDTLPDLKNHEQPDAVRKPTTLTDHIADARKNIDESLAALNKIHEKIKLKSSALERANSKLEEAIKLKKELSEMKSLDHIQREMIKKIEDQITPPDMHIPGLKGLLEHTINTADLDSSVDESTSELRITVLPDEVKRPSVDQELENIKKEVKALQKMDIFHGEFSVERKSHLATISSSVSHINITKQEQEMENTKFSERIKEDPGYKKVMGQLNIIKDVLEALQAQQTKLAGKNTAKASRWTKWGVNEKLAKIILPTKSALVELPNLMSVEGISNSQLINNFLNFKATDVKGKPLPSIVEALQIKRQIGLFSKPHMYDNLLKAIHAKHPDFKVGTFDPKPLGNKKPA